MKSLLLCLAITACFALEATTKIPLFGQFFNSSTRGWVANADLDFNGTNMYVNQHYSLQHNLGVARYTSVGLNFLVWFNQYFDFTNGIIYVVTGYGCQRFAFPAVNLEEEIEILIHNKTTYMGTRGEGIHLFFVNNTAFGQVEFVYYNEETRIVEKVQAYDFNAQGGLQGEYTTPFEFQGEHDASFWDLPESCKDLPESTKQIKAPQVFSSIPFLPENTQEVSY